MPKIKTRKAVAKRVELTATGKMKYKKANLRHNMGNKSSKRKRGMRKPGYLHPGDAARLEYCLPYGATK